MSCRWLIPGSLIDFNFGASYALKADVATPFNRLRIRGGRLFRFWIVLFCLSRMREDNLETRKSEGNRHRFMATGIPHVLAYCRHHLSRFRIKDWSAASPLIDLRIDAKRKTVSL